jgi:hypothetical protein
MNVHPDHRQQAEHALGHAQTNPVMSAEQSFRAAEVHALLAVERRLEELVLTLRDASSPQTPAVPRVVTARNGAATHHLVRNTSTARGELQDGLDRAADDGWPDTSMRHVAP